MSSCRASRASRTFSALQHEMKLKQLLPKSRRRIFPSTSTSSPSRYEPSLVGAMVISSE